MRIHARRIVVIGTSCAGKTTFAGALAQKLGLPHVELDALHWGPNWTQRENFAELVRIEAAKDEWIMDGNYSAERDLMWSRADLIIWLDYEMGVVVRRALRRTIKRSWHRTPLWSGNRESIRLSFFSKDSILLWVLTTWRSRRHKFRTALGPSGRYATKPRVHFCDPDTADRFLDELAH